MPFAFLLAQGVELGLQGIITRPGLIVGVSRVGFLLSGRSLPSDRTDGLMGQSRLPGPRSAGCDGTMPETPIITHPLLRLGRLPLGPGLRGLSPGSGPADLVVTATVAVPDAPVSRSYAWDVAWAVAGSAPS